MTRRPDTRVPSRSNTHSAGFWLVLGSMFLATVFTSQSASAQQYSVLHQFTGGRDGGNPTTGLRMDRAGNLYGTAFGDGLGNGSGFGTVFKLAYKNGSWRFAPLYAFRGGGDGAGPYSRIAVASNGILYGATVSGGTGGCNTWSPYIGCGTVFELQPPATFAKTPFPTWTETQLYPFTGLNDGRFPYGDLTLDQAGNIYGSTYFGGAFGAGVVYALASGTWAESVLYTFTGGNDGDSPHGGVVFGSDGNLYGTTLFGGSTGYGVVFNLTPAGPPWNENVLYTFQGGSDGGGPVGGVIFDGAGNMYGTTSLAGAGGGGTVFELTPSDGGWQLHTLCSFTGSDNYGDGSAGSLVMDADGNLYGANHNDGALGYGSVFKASQSGGNWTCTTLHDFTDGNDGAYPWDGLVLDSNGNIYGTASAGGTGSACSGGCGVVFEISQN